MIGPIVRTRIKTLTDERRTFKPPNFWQRLWRLTWREKAVLALAVVWVGMNVGAVVLVWLSGAAWQGWLTTAFAAGNIFVTWHDEVGPNRSVKYRRR